MSRVRIGLCAFVPLIALVSCGGDPQTLVAHNTGPLNETFSTADKAVLPPAAPAELTSLPLPLPAEISRTASGALITDGSMALQSAGCCINGDHLYLALDGAIDQVPPIEDEPALFSEPHRGLAYAVYSLKTLGPRPSTLRLQTGANFKTPIWLALANWRRGSWDFTPGKFFSTPEISLSAYGQGLNDYLNADGEVMVAIVVEDNTEPVEIHELQLNIVSEVDDLTASTNRWEGIRLRWDPDTDADAHRIWRRLADSGEGWLELSPEPLLNVQEYDDLAVPDGRVYEYLIRSADKCYPLGEQKLFWSNGRVVRGSVRPSTLKDVDPGVSRVLPVNLHNYLSFVCLSEEEAPMMSALRAAEFPPQAEWHNYGSADGIDSQLLSPVEGFEVPMHLYALETVNNPGANVGYTTAQGAFSQVATADIAGTVIWEQPVYVREPGHIVLDLVRLPRRIGMLTWNTNVARMELLDSIDMLGRYWYEFDPVTYPWMIVTTRKPEGAIDVLDSTGPLIICFRAEDSSGPVVLRSDGPEWTDISPQVEVGSAGLRLLSGLTHPALPARMLFYTDVAGSELCMLTQDHSELWHEDEVVTLVSAAPESSIAEFAIAVHGSYSHQNYLAYIEDGKVYAMECINAYFESWTEPQLISDSGSCRNLNIIPVGTSEDFSESYDFLSFVEEDGSGQTQIRYIDLSTTFSKHYN